MEENSSRQLKNQRKRKSPGKTDRFEKPRAFFVLVVCARSSAPGPFCKNWRNFLGPSCALDYGWINREYDLQLDGTIVLANKISNVLTRLPYAEIFKFHPVETNYAKACAGCTDC